MAKEPSKKAPSKAGIETEVGAEGFSVFLAFRDARTRTGVQLKLHRRGASALSALLRATESDGDDAGDAEVILRGELTLLIQEPTNENHGPSTISTE